MEDLKGQVCFGLLVLIWMVQLIVYPSFRFAQTGEFLVWHKIYMRAISWIVVPLMFGQVALVALTWSMDWRSVVQALGIAVAWGVTFLWSAPGHQELQRVGWDAGVIDRLVLTNWARTAAWTVVWLVGVIR